MVCGTASHVGKSVLVAGLCRVLADEGVAVAPFKGQNMALNSAVTADGREIGRAQALQAEAARVEPEAAMNPVLLKPGDDRTSQVLVLGRPWATLGAAAYHQAKAQLETTVLDALTSLRRRFEVVVLEGAGSPAEVNLMDHDLVNLGLARRAGVPAVIVGDIDRGGVFAHLLGTVELLPASLRRLVGGFVLNKFRGDPALLGEATEVLRRRCGVATLGVLPWLGPLGLDAEDSLSLPLRRPPQLSEEAGDVLDVAVVALPRLSNFTDVDPLAFEPQVSVRYVTHPGQLGRPDLVVLPGTKATVADLAWLRASGLAQRLEALTARGDGPALLGICGGFQMLGRRVEEPAGSAQGLGLVPAVSVFCEEKVLRRDRGRHVGSGEEVEGYLIHHNRTVTEPGASPLFELDHGAEGVAEEGRAIFGTSLHGLFEADGFRAAFLGAVAARRGRRFVPATSPFAAVRQEALDEVAAAMRAHLDLEALFELARRAT